MYDDTLDFEYDVFSEVILPLELEYAVSSVTAVHAIFKYDVFSEGLLALEVEYALSSFTAMHPIFEYNVSSEGLLALEVEYSLCSFTVVHPIFEYDVFSEGLLALEVEYALCSFTAVCPLVVRAFSDALTSSTKSQVTQVFICTSPLLQITSSTAAQKSCGNLVVLQFASAATLSESICNSVGLPEI